MPDLGDAITDSLSRSGEGGMLAPLRNVNGSVSAPAVSWLNEIQSGWYRFGAGDFRFSVANTDTFRITSAGPQYWDGFTWVVITSATPSNFFPGIAPTLTDTDAALLVGGTDPTTTPHLEFGPEEIQAKADETTANDLTLNPLGGDVIMGLTSGQFLEEMGPDDVPGASVQNLNILANNAPSASGTTSAPLTVGPFAGTHIEIGNVNIQAKSDATTGNNLILNALGGNVWLCANGQLKAEVYRARFQLRAPTTSLGENEIYFTDVNSAICARIGYRFDNILKIQNSVNGSDIVLIANTTGGAELDMLSADPDAGAVYLYNSVTGTGLERALTESDVTDQFAAVVSDETVAGTGFVVLPMSNTFAVASGETYKVEGYVVFSCSSALGGLAIMLDETTGLSGVTTVFFDGTNSIVAQAVGNQPILSLTSAGMTNGTIYYARVSGFIKPSYTGAMDIGFAQLASLGLTTVHEGSWLNLSK
jgi:hypothetical protein